MAESRFVSAVRTSGESVAAPKAPRTRAWTSSETDQAGASDLSVRLGLFRTSLGPPGPAGFSAAWGVSAAGAAAGSALALLNREKNPPLAGFTGAGAGAAAGVLATVGFVVSTATTGGGAW